MEITFAGSVSGHIQQYVRKRLRKVEHHFNQPATIEVSLNKEKTVYYSEGTIHAPRVSIRAKSQAPDLYTAIDSMSSKLDRQIIKYKERLKDHGRHTDGQRTIRHP